MSDARGGRYFGPARFFLAGDKVLAQRHIGEARMLLGYMRDQMLSGGPTYQVQYTELQDGTRIKAVMNNGLYQAEVISGTPSKRAAPRRTYIVGFIPYASGIGSAGGEMDHIYDTESFAFVPPGEFIADVLQPGLRAGNYYHVSDDRFNAVSSYMLVLGKNATRSHVPADRRMTADSKVHHRSARIGGLSEAATRSVVASCRAAGWDIVIQAQGLGDTEVVYARVVGASTAWVVLGTAGPLTSSYVSGTYKIHDISVDTTLNSGQTLGSMVSARNMYSQYRFNPDCTEAVRVHSLIDGNYSVERVHKWVVTWMEGVPTAATFSKSADGSADPAFGTTFGMVWSLDPPPVDCFSELAGTQNGTLAGTTTIPYNQSVDIGYDDYGNVQSCWLHGTVSVSGTGTATIVKPADYTATTMTASSSRSGVVDIKYELDGVPLCDAVVATFTSSGSHDSTATHLNTESSQFVTTTTYLLWADMRRGRYIVCECAFTVDWSTATDTMVETSKVTRLRVIDVGRGDQTIATFTCRGTTYSFSSSVTSPHPENVCALGHDWYVGDTAGPFATAIPSYSNLLGICFTHMLPTCTLTQGLSPVMLSAAMEENGNCLVSYAYAPVSDAVENNTYVLKLSGYAPSIDVMVVHETVAAVRNDFTGRLYTASPDYQCGIV